MKLDEAKKIINDLKLSREDILKILDLVEPDVITIKEQSYPYVPNPYPGITPDPYPLTPGKPYEPTWIGTDPFTCSESSGDNNTVTLHSCSNLTLDKVI